MFSKKKEKEPTPENGSERHVNENEKKAPPTPTSDNKNEPTDSEDHIYPSGFRLALILTSIYIGMFLVALVRGQVEDSSRSTPCIACVN
jgi:hypothetical protein